MISATHSRIASMYDKFIIFLSKEDLRDIRLGELGIE